MGRNARTILICICLFLVLITPCLATSDKPFYYQTVTDVVSVPDEEIDIVMARLIIEHGLYPTMDPNKVIHEIRRIGDAIKSRMPSGLSEVEQLFAMRHYLYEPGEWNEFKPWTYNQADPYGERPAGQFLSFFIWERKGSCMSMALLVYAVSKELGFDAYLSTAPMHVFVQIKPKGSNSYILFEVSTGKLFDPNKIADQMNVSEAAIEHKTYLQPMEPKQAVAEVIRVWATKNYGLLLYDEQFRLADYLEALYPGYIHADVIRADGFLFQMKRFGMRHGIEHERELKLLLPEEQEEYHRYRLSREYYLNRAKSKGWRYYSKEDMQKEFNIGIPNEKVSYEQTIL